MIYGERSRTKKAVLFDIDGTILNAFDFIYDAVKHSVKTHGYPYPSEDVFKKATGKPLLEFYSIILPMADSAALAQTHHDFQKENFHLIKIYPKVKQTLKHLKQSGFLLAAVSNRSRDSLIYSLELNEILKYFDTVVSADDVVNPKPHQEHLLTALMRLEIEPVNAFMVGDTDKDIVAGKNAEVKTIGVTYGFLGKDIAKHNPDYLIDDIEELLQILK